ncbi:hypothetical protein BDA96_01G145300 [Sorghum bicolor]|uniref:Uncharacterized protein n=1 Tax=Sorghum bicolor TaxID=4558 RepID=A0A921RX82_SORBI|nr:hypothetical protein BDA96_01G145300 [Sorghum bicolor]
MCLKFACFGCCPQDEDDYSSVANNTLPRGRQPSPWPQQHQGQGFALVPQRGMATAPPPAASSYAPQHTARVHVLGIR